MANILHSKQGAAYRWYAVAVALAGLGTAIVGQMFWHGQWAYGQVALILAVFSLTAVARAFPLKVSPQAEASLAGAPIFMAALLLMPLQAVIAGAAGSFAADVRLRRRSLVMVFNMGVTSLAAGLASITFHSLVSNQSFELLSPWPLAAAVAAGLVLHSMNIGAMAGMVSLRKGLAFWPMWRNAWAADVIQEGGVIILGYLAAVLWLDAWWSLLLLWAPLALAHLALGTSVRQASENVALAQKLQEQMRELRETQAQLVQAAKMASVGTLAAGVAHEINNPLFVMMGRAELLLHYKDRHFKTDVAERYLKDIYDQGVRASGIVRDLLDHSRKDAPVGPVSLPDAMAVATRLVGEGLKAHGVTIREEYDSVPAIQGRSAALQQVFVNLLLNAQDAMEGTGEVTLRCWAEEGRVYAAVRDTGPGISPEYKDRLFEPFFTTKEVGKGTGLGLFICHRIVAEHEGCIRIDNAPDGGAVVTIELAAAQAAPAASAPAERAGAPIAVSGRLGQAMAASA